MAARGDIAAALQEVATATLATLLLKRGLRNTWMRGPRALERNGPRIVGPAFTLRFVPAREDLSTPESLAKPVSTRTAIEAIPAGCVCVADAMGIGSAGILGDILCARMVKRGVAGLVTDGAVRDAAAVARTGLPVWCAGAAAPPSVAALTFAGWGETIGCGGVAIVPGDWIVADDDGAVVIPSSMLEDIVQAAPEQERLEAWIMGEVEKGQALPGLYPPDAANRARYERDKGKG